MTNSELRLLTDWRFCKMDLGVKSPRYANWQKTPFSLQSVPQSGNVGILTGSQSNGVIAIDFDGEFAWRFWDENIKIPFDIINTVSWTSGRDARCQMAFKIPQEMWEFVKTFKITNDEKTEGIEFRWEGCQSVLPPSIHPDTQKPYEWVQSPSSAPVQEIPLDLLEWMINYSPLSKVEEDLTIQEVQIEDLTIDKFNEIEKVLKRIHDYEPQLSYDDWIRITWSTVSHVGSAAGIELMKEFWPEKEKNEYARLMRGWSISKSPKFGSLIHRAASHNITKYDGISGYMTRRQTINDTFYPNKQQIKKLF